MSVDCWNPKAELLTRKELSELQLKKIKRQLHYVYEKSAFYRKKLKAAGVVPGEINSLEDYARKVPFTYKSELREIQASSPPLGDNLCVPYNQVSMIITSTGTTGNPTYTAVDKHDWDLWIEMLKRSFWMSGFRPGDVYLHAFALGTWISGLSYASAAREFGMAVLPIGVPTPAARMLRIAKDCRANVMVGTPSYAEHLAGKVKEILNIDSKDFGLRKLGLGGEPGAGVKSERERIEELWGADVRDRMGSPEIAPGNRSECKYKNGMHNVTNDMVYDEIVDPETKELLESREGTEGALVYSALEQECYPLLRFYVNDQVRVMTDECPCSYPGITLSVIGRLDDMIKIKGVKIWPSSIKDTLTTFLPRITGEFRIVASEQLLGFAARGPIKLKIEFSSSVKDTDLRALKNSISEKIVETLHFRPDEIEMVPEGTLERSEFKAKYIEKSP